MDVCLDAHLTGCASGHSSMGATFNDESHCEASVDELVALVWTCVTAECVRVTELSVCH